MNTDSDQKVKVLVNGSWIFFPRSFLQILGKCQTCLKTIRRAKWWFWNDTSNSFCQSFNKKFSTIDTYFANYNASLWNLFFLLVVKNSHHGKQLLEVFVYIYFWILATVSNNSVRYQAINSFCWWCHCSKSTLKIRQPVATINGFWWGTPKNSVELKPVWSSSSSNSLSVSHKR